MSNGMNIEKRDGALYLIKAESVSDLEDYSTDGSLDNYDNKKYYLKEEVNFNESWETNENCSQILDDANNFQTPRTLNELKDPIWNCQMSSPELHTELHKKTRQMSEPESTCNLGRQFDSVTSCI